MNAEKKEDKTNAGSQTVDHYLTDELTDLPVAGEQTEEVKGGAQCQNNLKQMGIGVHNVASIYPD